ncbi:uncharacterized protein [Asterias amurensis]|uniref:uncharacterized protein isoform X2 n=1 Tax=Asterias amurensis TaxID=7602 RepID=UPI003AB4221E
MDPKRRECYAIRVKLSLPAPIAYTQVEIKLCTYFQSNEGGNCDVDSVRLMGVDADGSWYKVAFVEQSGVTKMLARSDHEMVVDGIKIPLEVQGCPAPLPGTSESASSEEILSGELQEDEQLIEVNGVRRSTETEFVKLYFESPRKSGGGEIKMLVRESKIGAISITFKDPSVASIVAGRKHKLSGTTLNVKLITKKKRPPLPINARCLFLEGIPDGCSSEHLKLFIENRASMDEEPTIQYGEKPGTAICTFSRDIPDLEHVIRNISQRKLRGASLRAEKVQHSDAILVQGVPQDLEMVELYFDNKKKSGSSGVRDVQPGPMVGQAIVYFEDWKVVQDVLTKGHHKLGGKDLQIESYYDFLGRLSPLDAPTPHIPKPVLIEVHEPTMEFLYGKGENTMKKLLKDLAKVKANLLWPDGSQKSRAKLEPVVDESQHQSSWLNWEKEAVDVLTDFMGGCKAARVPVSQTLWKDEADALQKENLQDDPEEDEPKEDEQLIVVTGMKQSTDLELLKLYFESPRKSGGGEIETVERESKTGAIIITFKDPSVTSIVAGRKHKLSGAALNVKLITKKKRRPLPINARCLFLERIPDGCSSEHVKLFIESRASMDEEPTIQYGERPGTAICTFSRDIPDLEDVIRNISQRKLRGASLRAEKVQHSDAILVQGVPQELEMVELYFDNKKMSGGSGVREVKPGPMDEQVIVYFEDWKVVQDVLTKGRHKVCGKDLQIVSYHDFMGRLGPLDAPTTHIPKPVSIEVQESIMEFLYGKGENTKKRLLKELAMVKANLLWPDGFQKSRAKLEPVIGDSQHQSSWLKWEKKAVDVLTDFMRGYKTARVPVPQTLWKDAVDKLQKMTTACSMVPDPQLHEVILVGEQRDVDVAEATINDIIKKLQKDADYDAEQTKEDITWDVEKLQLFTMCGIKQEIEKSFPALKITVFSSYGKTGITLDGIRKTIKDVELKIRRWMDCLEKTEFKSGSTKVRFVQHVPDKIHEVLGLQNIRAACSGSDDGKITIYGATSRDIREAKAYIDNEIDEDTIEIKGQSALAVLQGHDGKRLFDSINKQKFVLAGISHEPGVRFIKLAGFKRHLEETKKHILDFLKKKVITKSTIPSNKNKIRLITTYHGQELEKVKQQHQQNLVAIQAQMSGRNRGFIIQGNEEGLDAVRKLVTSLVQAVKEKHYPVSKTGMARLFREEKGKKFLESVEREFHCMITTDCNEESDDDEEEEGAGHASTATQILYSVTLPESRCRLRVCQGDLTMQRVDCIVNAANVELQHIGGLAAAVLKAGGPVIQTESDNILKQKRRKLHVGEAVLTSSGNLPCKKVIHVAGPKWQAWGRTIRGGVTNEEQQLFDAVLNCLQLASEQKFQSIAIPAVSTGVHGFPVQLAAEEFLDAVGQFVWTTPNSSVTDISLTNHDQPTCAVFMQAVAKRFASWDDQAGVTMAAADILAGKFSAAINIGVKDDKKKEELQETVILQLSAMDMNSLMKASAKLDRFLIEVIWKYSTPLGMVSYDEEVNAILEEAYQKKKTTVALDLQGGKAVIDFQQMQEILNGSVVKHIHRVNLKIAARSEPPSNWTQMDQREFTKMVKLSVGSAEYTAVETKFRASMGPFNNIVEIERIQNRDLMMTYQARRAALVHRLNRATVEKVLYHGTDEQTSKKIISHGFNRSFGGKNATAYGNGTYFAVAASYSASPQYAKPNANGTKHIFVTNVLVGDFVRGSQGMITPPPKPQNPAELFDSVVDNMNAPGIYVIFHDAQAYPQYLIKFK